MITRPCSALVDIRRTIPTSISRLTGASVIAFSVVARGIIFTVIKETLVDVSSTIYALPADVTFAREFCNSIHAYAMFTFLMSILSVALWNILRAVRI